MQRCCTITATTVAAAVVVLKSATRYAIKERGMILRARAALQRELAVALYVATSSRLIQ
jgi:hypothetical protein